ncbi:MAG: hypothetical protein V8S96_03865 [Lachnospiraceae bacterium]
MILGGPMTGGCIGHQIKCKELPQAVTKVSGGLLLLKNDEWRKRLVSAAVPVLRPAPAGLTPWKIDFAVRNEIQNGAKSCMQRNASAVAAAPMYVRQNAISARIP